MKKIIIICFLIFAAGNCFGQQVTFQKTFGGTGVDWGLGVQQTSDGGYIITGMTTSFGAGNSYVYLIKTDANGDTLWTKTFGGTSYDYGYSVQQTTDGGYIVVGIKGVFSTNAEVYLIKTDMNGDSLWIKTFGGLNNDEGLFVQQTADGGFIITGRTNSFGAGDYDVYLIKTDINGNLLWTKTFGGPYADEGTSIQPTMDGGYIITGSTQTFGVGDYDIYLIKTDSVGDSLWTKTLGESGADVGHFAKQTTDGGYIITGWSESALLGGADVFLTKTDSNGNPLWTKILGWTYDDFGYSVQQTMDGGYIITGSIFDSSSTGYLIKTNANGDTLWTKTFGGVASEYGRFIQQTTDGGYIIIGFTESFGSGFSDVYLIKTDSMGNSGCNEGNHIALITTPVTQVTSPVTTVTSPAAIVTTPATIVGSGGTVTTLCTTVGIAPISDFQSSFFNISPNPTTNNFTITFPNTINNKGTVEIYNVLGKKIFTEDVINVSQKEILLKNINAGIYFVKVKDLEKEYSKKLVIE